MSKQSQYYYQNNGYDGKSVGDEGQGKVYSTEGGQFYKQKNKVEYKQKYNNNHSYKHKSQYNNSYNKYNNEQAYKGNQTFTNKYENSKEKEDKNYEEIVGKKKK